MRPHLFKKSKKLVSNQSCFLIEFLDWCQPMLTKSRNRTTPVTIPRLLTFKRGMAVKQPSLTLCATSWTRPRLNPVPGAVARRLMLTGGLSIPDVLIVTSLMMSLARWNLLKRMLGMCCIFRPVFGVCNRNLHFQ